MSFNFHLIGKRVLGLTINIDISRIYFLAQMKCWED
jgi:hypothetical protein